MAIYIDGGMGLSDREHFEAHVADCDRCRELLAEVARTPVMDEETGGTVVPFRARTLRKVAWASGGLVAAAASLIVIVRVLSPQPEQVVELVDLRAALSRELTRPVAGRLAGGFEYGLPPVRLRGEAPRDLSPDTRIALGRLQKRADASDSPQFVAASGIAFLVLGDHDRAIERLERAAQLDSSNASLSNDLAVAYLARADLRTGRDDAAAAADSAKALEAAERANRLAPDQPEGWFNRALALERLRPGAVSADAWREYLKKDPASSWHDEAQRRLSAIDFTPR